MIKGSEDALGFKILDRKIGGVGGGGSILTREGIDFLETYINFEKEINEKASQIFDKHFYKFTT